jgi:hypothetical protein
VRAGDAPARTGAAGVALITASPGDDLQIFGLPRDDEIYGDPNGTGNMAGSAATRPPASAALASGAGAATADRR